MKNSIIIALTVAVVALSACKKETETPEPTAVTPTTTTPTVTYDVRGTWQMTHILDGSYQWLKDAGNNYLYGQPGDTLFWITPTNPSTLSGQVITNTVWATQVVTDTTWENHSYTPSRLQYYKVNGSNIKRGGFVGDWMTDYSNTNFVDYSVIKEYSSTLMITEYYDNQLSITRIRFYTKL